jgi:2-polyprenyl-3-methyl-5-hydroxy-6-metoxy-1,4-benzoquinol methylase
MLVRLKTLKEVDDLIQRTNLMESEENRIQVLCDHYYSPEIRTDAPPTAPEYRQLIMGIYAHIRGTPDGVYAPEIDEKSPFVEKANVFCTGGPYNYQSSAFVGEFLIAYGFILKCMAMRAGMRVIEYGPGSGQILLHLARVGCQVTAVDIEPQYLDIIQTQATAMGLNTEVLCGSFGAAPVGAPPYDAVLFFEAFHHCLEHQQLINQLHDIVTASGQVVFAGEPIIGANDYWRPVIPYPWGPRLDLLSLRATRTYGWLELGFQEEYFVRLLLRNGWFVRKYRCSLTARGDTWIAKENHGVWSPGITELPSDEAETWHEPEGEFVWTKQLSVMTLDGRMRWERVSIECKNPLPFSKTIKFKIGSQERTVLASPGQQFDVEFPLAAGVERILAICCEESVPRRLGINEDGRGLGITVYRVVYA